MKFLLLPLISILPILAAPAPAPIDIQTLIGDGANTHSPEGLEFELEARTSTNIAEKRAAAAAKMMALKQGFEVNMTEWQIAYASGGFSAGVADFRKQIAAHATSSASASKTSSPVAASSTSKPAVTSSSSSKPAVVSSSSSKPAVTSSSSSKPAATSSSSSKPAATSSSSSKPAATSSSSSKAAVASSSSSKAAVSSSSTTSKAASSTSSAAPSASATNSAGLTWDQQRFLDLHNTFRAQYGAAALTWNTTLATYAANDAKTCKYAHTGGPYGENIAAGTPFYGSNQSPSGGYSIDSGFTNWGSDEAKLYNYSAPGYSEKTGHFTQIVWKSTKQIGCAAYTCADGTIFNNGGKNSEYLVCEFYPPGNIVSSNSATTAQYFTANVGKPV